MRHATADMMRHVAISITNGRWRPIRWQFGFLNIVFLLIVVVLASSQAASIVKNDIDANYDNDIGNVTNTAVTTTTTSVTPIDTITLPNDVSAVATTVNFTVTTKTASSTLSVPMAISVGTTPSTPKESTNNSLNDTLVSSTLASEPMPVTVPTAAVPVDSSTQLPLTSAAPATPTVTKPYRGSTTFKSATTTNRSAKLVSNDIGQNTNKEADKHIDGPSIVEAPQGDQKLKQLIGMLNPATLRAIGADLAAYTTETYHFDLNQ